MISLRALSEEPRNKVEMPFRRVPQQSDRGSIHDLANGDDEKQPPTEEELRLKSLYEHGLATRDEALLASLGLIAIDGAAKDPIAILKHKQYIESLKEKLAEQIQQSANELSLCFASVEDSTPPELRYMKTRQEDARRNIQPETEFVKRASYSGTSTIKENSFRRVK
jgi:hypothetical protein